MSREMMARLPLPLIVGIFIALASAYSVVVPLGETPHFFYIQYLVERHGLPPPEGAVVGESPLPPLYYFLGTLVTAWIPRSNFQVIANPDFVLYVPRTPNLLLHDVREIFIDSPLIALGVALFAEFLPGFLFISGTVSDDNLISMIGSLIILQTVRMWRRDNDRVQFVGLGIMLGVDALLYLRAIYAAV